MESHPQNPVFRNNPENFHHEYTGAVKALARLCRWAVLPKLLLLIDVIRSTKISVHLYIEENQNNR